jgi:hypothetical protein
VRRGVEMGLLRDARAYARFHVGLKDFLHRRLTPESAREIVRQRMARRG